MIARDILIRYRYPLTLLCSLVCIGLAVWLVKYYLAMKEEEIRRQLLAQQAPLEVVVAKADLPAGARIGADTMSIRRIPSGFVPDGAIAPSRFSEVEGKTLLSPMTSGRPLIRHNVKDVSRVERFSDLLSTGQRALTLEVSGTSSVEHMLEAGDRIDLAVRDRQSGMMRSLLEQVTVLATGNVTTADPKFSGMYKHAEYDSLTIGVDSADVARVLVAEKQGDLIFLLRNGKDEARSHYVGISGGAIEVIAGHGSADGLLSSTVETLQVTASVPAVLRNRRGHLLQKLAVAEQKHEVRQ